jgi:putative ABC transport system permease protein
MLIANLWSDIRYTLRTFRNEPGFAVAAVAPIALGIGLNTGLFTMIGNAVLRPLPTPASVDLVAVYQDFQGVKGRRVHGARTLFSLPEYQAYRDGARSFSGVMAFSKPWAATLGPGASEEADGALVSCNYFGVLQVRLALGAGFQGPDCESPAASPSIVLTHALWTRVFGADRDIVHKTIVLNGQLVAIAGVAPEGFDGVDRTRVAFFGPPSLQTVLHAGPPFIADPQTSWLTIIGRRGPGVALEQARADLGLIARRIDQQQPGRSTTLSVVPATLVSLPVARRGVLAASSVALAAFGLLLLIACANVANLLLARAGSRRKEIAVRLALGASRGRLVQQLLTESAIVAVLGGVIGSLVAWWSFQVLVAWLIPALVGSSQPPRIDTLPDATAIRFALALTAVTTVVFGLAPALQASRPDVHGVMKQDTFDGGGRRVGWLRSSLIAVQVALCALLLIVSGLLLRSLHAVQTVDPGFDAPRITVVSSDLRGPRFTEPAVAAFQKALAERLTALPGVEAVAHAMKVPMSPGRMQMDFRRSADDQAHDVDVNIVSPEFFSVTGIPIVRGRTFSAAELGATRRAVIVTESTARRYWPGQDPVGRTILMSGNAPLEIVGVARDAHVSPIPEVMSSYMYLPPDSGDHRRLAVLLRSQAELASLERTVRIVTQELDPGTLVRVIPLETNLDRWRLGSRTIAGLSALISVLALILASAGVYGVVSFVVSRRRREVAIRMALGARPTEVRRLVLAQTMRPVVAGLVCGIAGAAAGSQALVRVLFGVSRFDPVAFVASPLVLLAVASLAAIVPMRRAASIDPMLVLRRD